LGTVVDSGQHDDRRGRIHADAARQENGDGTGWPDSGQNANKRPDKDPHQAIKQVHRNQRNGKSELEVLQKVHNV